MKKGDDKLSDEIKELDVRLTNEIKKLDDKLTDKIVAGNKALIDRMDRLYDILVHMGFGYREYHDKAANE